MTQTRPANISTLTAGGISPDVAQLLQSLPPDMRANAIAQIANNQRLEAELTKKQNEQSDLVVAMWKESPPSFFDADDRLR